MTSEPLGGGDQPVDLGRGQVLPAAALGIGLFRRRSHGEWTFPKTISGAVVAGAFRTKPHLGPKQVTFPKRYFFGNVASRCYQNGAMTCQLTGARRLHMALEALLIAVTLAKHLKFNGFKNFEGLGLEPQLRPLTPSCRMTRRPTRHGRD